MKRWQMCELIQTELNPSGFPWGRKMEDTSLAKIYVDLNEFLVDFYGA